MEQEKNPYRGCSNPFLKNHEGVYHTLPCGKCPFCQKKRISNWSFRLMQEEKRSESAYFITLTYKTDQISKQNGTLTQNGYMTLNKRHIQLFMKKLRKSNPRKLKYYMAGEYGTDNDRPHYHMIIFNAYEHTIAKAWSDDKGKQRGHVDIGTVTEASVGYTLKYICKEGKKMHENDDRLREFSLMSKRLGANYITDEMVKWHKADLNTRMYVNLKDGKKASMPRYYKEKIYTNDEKGDLKAYNTARYVEEIEEFLMKTDDEKIQRMVKAWKETVKAEHHKQLINNKNRNLNGKEIQDTL